MTVGVVVDTSNGVVAHRASAGLSFLVRFAEVTTPPIISRARDNSGEALFLENGELAFSVAFWSGAERLEGFLIRDESTGIEVLIHDPARLDGEPLLRHVAETLSRDAGLSLD